ncbi:MAG: ATP-binding protein [Firmicutes bacterium]|uniref:ATP-binding protein n=1 Tax=Candidatus Onthovivens merdipullorum TaxID=2840889 RepID=A0A9D9DJ59_9BACL|nr:ATP-binding protein [Candidatus Onthovivens merdipullorum]
MFIKRDIKKFLLDTSSDYSCILLTGPRQVGKTFLFETLSDDNRQKVSLDDIEIRHLATTDPKLFFSIYKTPILIDEVQYAPELFQYIKIAIDKGARPGSFWLTGSQIFRLMRLSGESLAGRVALLNLLPLSQHEIYNQDKPLFDTTLKLDSFINQNKLINKVSIDEIYKRIFKGGMPGIISQKYNNENLYYSSYLNTYVLRDIMQEANVNGLKYLEFLRATAVRIGQVLNIHSIAQDVDISDETAKRWLSLLEKCGIIYYLYPYSRNDLKRTIKAPKLYFFDTGLVRYLARYVTSEELSAGALNGAILENYVINEIIKTYYNQGKNPFLYYYHDKDQNEIDLIIDENGLLHPFEIKRSESPTIKMTKAFNILRNNLNNVGIGGIICTRDSFTMLDENTLVIPVSFL